MKTPDHTQLEKHIRKELSAAGGDLPLVDWGEVEVLLGKETTTVQLPDKKYFFIGGAALVLLAALFFIVRIFSSSSGDPTDAPPPPASTDATTILPKTDTATPTTAVPVMKDTVREIQKDTATQTANATRVVPADTSRPKSTGSPTQEVKAPEEKLADKKQKPAEVKRPEKKTKISALAPTISDDLPSDNLLLPDTAGKSKPAAAKQELPAAADSAGAAPARKPGKTKKGKAPQKPAQQENAPARPDSLK